MSQGIHVICVTAAGLEDALSGSPFVGRRPEVARIRAAHADGVRTGTQVVCEVVGDPGIGKTRLVHAALDSCAPALPRAVGTCVEAERDIPFHVFRHAFGAPHPARADPGRPTAGAEPDGLPALRSVGPLDVRQFRTYQLARRLLTLAARDGLALVLDDLHWADTSSTGLVTHLLRYPVPAPLLLLLVYRPRQLDTAMPFGPPDAGVPGGRGRERIELGPLSLADTVALYPHDDPAELGRRHDRAAGNPGYLAALDGVGPDGDRDPPSTAGPRLTDRAVATLRAEWTGLSPVDATCLRAAAVCGTPCGVDLLAEVARLPAREVTESAWRLVRRDLLRVVPATARFTFRHPVLRAAVTQDTDPAWRAEAHHRALTVLLARQAPPAERVAQAEHLLGLPHGRPVEPYVDVLCRAAGEIRGDAPELAVRWLRTALHAVRPPAGSPDTRHDVTLLLARITGEMGNLAESRALLREVVPELPVDPTGRRAAAVAQWVRVERLLGNYAEAAAISRRELVGTPTPTAGAYQLATELGAIGILSGHPSPVPGGAPDGEASGIDRAGLLAVRGLAAAHDGEVQIARELLAAGAPIVDALPDRDLRERPDCLLAFGLAELFLERPADATRHLDRGITLVRDAHRDDGLCQLLLGRSQVAYHRGQLGTVIGLTTEAGGIARRIGSRSLLSFALAFEAQATAWRGGPRDDDRAVALARTAVDLANDLDSWSGRTAATALATATLLAGDPATCVEMLTDAGGDSRLTRLQASLRPMWHELLCAAALAAGDLPEAYRRARAALAAADLLGLPGQHAFAESAYGEVLLARGEVLTALPYLRTAADRFRAAGMMLRHSLALVAIARASEAVDQGGPALRARRRAQELAARCGTERVGLRLARPVRALTETALTDREWHIARLASTGVTNRLIGRQLHISPRTVEAHLTRIYRKAGVESRSGLVAWVSRFDDTDR
ncbi:AAA family ATPase [Micromonospora sp. S-DT3-3-22]|uniref:ATP-binding protein n=1 Tax=Micromonospora sp. S-DT3-3-22 TaxID=2755359 RepID=UPI00188E80F0|nr:AAA family ATPase [Micromonospora sp. S-DT3-3-22]